MTRSAGAFSAALRSALICAGAGIAIAWCLWKWNSHETLIADDLLSVNRTLGGTIAQISVTLAGFILTSTAIFTAFSDKPLVQNMYKSGHASNLITHMYIAILFTIIACIIGVWALVAPAPGTLTVVILIGAGGACLTALLGVMRKLWFVLHFINGGPDARARYENIDHAAKEVPPRVP